VQRRHDRCVFTISHSKCICFCNFVILSFKWEKKRGGGDEVKVGKLLIVNYISRLRNKMSLEKHCFSKFSLFFNLYAFILLTSTLVRGKKYIILIRITYKYIETTFQLSLHTWV